MLNIVYGDMKEAIYDTASYFNHVYLDHWILEDFSKQIIKGVDRATVLSAQAVDSKALGVIPVTSLSGGTKTLLLIDHMPQMVFNASTCGDNCAKWILKIAGRHTEDITINLLHMMDFGDKPFEVRIVNNGKIVHSMEEIALTAGFFL